MGILRVHRRGRLRQRRSLHVFLPPIKPHPSLGRSGDATMCRANCTLAPDWLFQVANERGMRGWQFSREAEFIGITLFFRANMSKNLRSRGIPRLLAKWRRRTGLPWQRAK